MKVSFSADKLQRTSKDRLRHSCFETCCFGLLVELWALLCSSSSPNGIHSFALSLSCPLKHAHKSQDGLLCCASASEQC